MAGTGGYFNETNKLPAASAPYAKLITRHTLNSLGRNIYDIRRATVTGQGSDPTTIRMSPNGGCGASTTADVPVILGLDTQAMIDSYGIPILGGPSEPGPGNLFTQNIGPNGVAATLGFRSAKGLARKLPFLSGLTAKRGVRLLKYGDYDYVDENNVTHVAPGTPDPVVSKPQVQINPAVISGVDLSSIALTAGDDGEGAQVKVDGTTITRDPTTGILSSAGGGGGGPGDSRRAANLTIDSDFNFPANPQEYIPWNECINGAAVYLDISNPDGLTIPADGGGDYYVWSQMRVQAISGGLSGNDWSSEWTISIELWRSGTQIIYAEQQDLYQNPNNDPDVQYWDTFDPYIGAVVPDTLPGDVIKIGLQITNGGAASIHSATYTVWGGWAGTAGSPNPNNGWFAWISIAPVGGFAGAATVVTVTANYTVSTTDTVVIANAASLTITLPSAVTSGSGRTITVKNGPSGTSTTVASAAGTIDGAVSDTSLTAAYAAATYISDGTNWLKV